MKRILPGLLGLLLLVTLAACRGPSADPPPNSEIGLSGEETSDHNRPSSDTVDPEQAYDELIQKYRAIAADPEGDWDTDEPGVMEFWENARSYLYNYEEIPPVDVLGYAVTDLSGDGIPELVVGDIYGAINALYTLADGQPRFVFGSSARSSYSYVGDGCFYYFGSNSAVESGQGVFVLTRDAAALECRRFLFTRAENEDWENLTVYTNTTGSWDPAESEKADMTPEEFWEVGSAPADMVLEDFRGLDCGKVTLPLTPFASLGPELPNRKASFVSVDYAPEDVDYDEVIVDSGEYSCRLLFTAIGNVERFAVLELTLDDCDEDGTMVFSARPVSPAVPDTMCPLYSVAVELTFIGDIPNYGIQYEDSCGGFHRFALFQSGYDGSILLEEADPEASEFVLRPGQAEDELGALASEYGVSCSATVPAELGGGITLELDLQPGGEVFYGIFRDETIAEYEGRWQLLDPEASSARCQLELALTRTYGVEDNHMWGIYGAGEVPEEIRGVWDVALNEDELRLIYVDQGDPLVEGYDYTDCTITFRWEEAF